MRQPSQLSANGPPRSWTRPAVNFHQRLPLFGLAWPFTGGTANRVLSVAPRSSGSSTRRRDGDIVYAENECSSCPTGQTDGRLLADRAMSRLLKEDWPRSLEEWEFHIESRRD